MVNQNESLDVNGKTVEEAIEEGLTKLNLTRDQVEIQVISEGKRGIFGIGAEDATVRLTPKAQAEPPRPETSTPEVEIEPEPEPASEEITRAHKEAVEPAAVEISDEVEEEEAAEPEQAVDTVPDAIPEEKADVAEVATKHLAMMLELMGIEAQITTRMAPDLVDPGDEPPLVLDITGKDLGILIGRRSETLQALQYMVRLMVSKEFQSWQRVVVDVESYRARRRQSLHQMAKRMAERAVSSGERVVMEAMTAYDRRIIHVALRDHPEVITKSVGRDSNRKVTIIPK